MVSNVPAVVMEEITPLATAQHTLLAPEEIQVSRHKMYTTVSTVVDSLCL